MLAEQLEHRPVTQRNIDRAVQRSRPFSKEGLQERLFARLFSGLVYAQIWEDPCIDLEALALAPGEDVVAIASGGCNILSYLTADPGSVTAVDLNGHHVALNRLKIAGVRHLPDHETFFRFFGAANTHANVAIYDAYLQAHLDDSTRRYWDARDWRGRRRIEQFAGNIYKKGLLGRFIGAGHLVAKLYRKDPRKILAARNLAEQRAVFESEMRPIFRSRLVEFLVDNPTALYGLGIPPAQYKSLLTSAPAGKGMAAVLEQRLERLACDFPIHQNYFAWQAFGRQYADAHSNAGKDSGAGGAAPPYLAAENFADVAKRAERVSVRHANMIDVLEQAKPASFDAYVLLDAQDWMTDAVLLRLWQAILHSAKPGARVIFRTAAEASLLPGRLPADLLARFAYDEAACKAWTLRDRSAIYGGFHLYRLGAAV
jgi:S-adenosylmethionine-diacylglycerol 3-amino-3-carboxypropyl transferase